MTEQTQARRPFLKYWDYLEDLELKRRKGAIPDDRHLMALSFIEQIGAENFLNEARHVHAIREIGRFYGYGLETLDDLHSLLSDIEQSPTHVEIFYYAFYFAAWVKQEVTPTQRRFVSFDERIKLRVEEGGSLQSMLRDAVEIVGYIRFRRYFETMGINRVHLFLDFKNIQCLNDLTALDDLECRHLLD